jgi:hypothetical protein
MVRYGQKAEELQQMNMQAEFKTLQRNAPTGSNRKSNAGHAAVWQARLIMLVMINIAQLWILAATVEAALARHYSVLIPLVVGSGGAFSSHCRSFDGGDRPQVRRQVPGIYAERMVIRRLRKQIKQISFAKRGHFPTVRK